MALQREKERLAENSVPARRFSQPLYTEHNAMGVVMAEQRHKASESSVSLAGTKHAILPPLTPCCLLFPALCSLAPFLHQSRQVSLVLPFHPFDPVRALSSPFHTLFLALGHRCTLRYQLLKFFSLHLANLRLKIPSAPDSRRDSSGSSMTGVQGGNKISRNRRKNIGAARSRSNQRPAADETGTAARDIHA